MSAKMNWKVLGVGLCLGLALTGCQPAKSTLSVGLVDTAVLLEDDPEYQQLSVSYMKEDSDLKADFGKRAKEAGKDEAKIRKLQEEFLVKQKAFEEKWLKATEDYSKKHTEAMKSKAEAIAKRKSIDLIIVDSKKYPTVEWGGVDMTTDMKLAMSQSGGEQSSGEKKE